MEGPNQGGQDDRVEKLWKTLDTRKEGRLDANGLKRGLEKIDHREFSIPLGVHRLTRYSTKKRGYSAAGCFESA